MGISANTVLVVGVLCNYSLDFATMLLQAQVTEDGMVSITKPYLESCSHTGTLKQVD